MEEYIQIYECNRSKSKESGECIETGNERVKFRGYHRGAENAGQSECRVIYKSTW